MSPKDEKYARASLLALAAECCEGDDDTRVFDSYTVAPDQRLLNADSVVAILASLPKPIACSATATGSTLRIECHQRMREASNRYDPASLFREALLAYISRPRVKRAGDRRVLIRGVGDPVLMTADEVSGWLQDYDFGETGVGFRSDVIDAEAKRLNAEIAVRLTGPVTPDYFRVL